MHRLATILLALAPLAGLGGCDQLGIESASAVAARREAEGKAVGAGCRQAARSVEQCYESNKRADKAAVFAGWREMNDYMRENQLQAQPAPDAEPATEVAAATPTDAAGEGVRRAKASRPDKADKDADKPEKAGKGDKPARAGKADQ